MERFFLGVLVLSVLTPSLSWAQDVRCIRLEDDPACWRCAAMPLDYSLPGSVLCGCDRTSEVCGLVDGAACCFPADIVCCTEATCEQPPGVCPEHTTTSRAGDGNAIRFGGCSTDVAPGCPSRTDGGTPAPDAGSVEDAGTTPFDGGPGERFDADLPDGGSNPRPPSFHGGGGAGCSASRRESSGPCWALVLGLGAWLARRRAQRG